MIPVYNYMSRPDKDEVFINQGILARRISSPGTDCDNCCFADRRCSEAPQCAGGTFVRVDPGELPEEDQHQVGLAQLKGELL